MVRGSRLNGKTALITGAGHRLGRAIALGLAEQGCGIVIHYYQAQEQAARTAEDIRALGVPAYLVQADLRSTTGVDALYAAIDDAALRLNILINAAAVMLRRDLLDVTAADWQDSIGLNLKGTFFCSQAGARRMDPGGVIINISDVAAYEPWKPYPLLSISKAGVEMLTRVSALSLAPDIRVNAIAPGPVLKPDGMTQERWDSIGRETPLGRSGTPEDVVAAVLFLIQSEYISGETLVVDGGWRLT